MNTKFSFAVLLFSMTLAACATSEKSQDADSDYFRSRNPAALETESDYYAAIYKKDSEKMKTPEGEKFSDDLLARLEGSWVSACVDLIEPGTRYHSAYARTKLTYSKGFEISELQYYKLSDCSEQSRWREPQILNLQIVTSVKTSQGFRLLRNIGEDMAQLTGLSKVYRPIFSNKNKADSISAFTDNGFYSPINVGAFSSDGKTLYMDTMYKNNCSPVHLIDGQTWCSRFTKIQNP